IYPDGEKIKYYYNMGGLLNKITGEKNYLYTYVDDIQYDEYEQRSLVKYGNGTTTEYKYENVLHRLDTMRVSNKDGLFLNNKYSYDKVNNVLGVKNSAALNVGIGGTMIHTYEYDDWHRLKTATGTFESADGQKRAEYKLDMGYDNLYNITSKKLTMSQTNLQFAGALSAGHEFIYRYSDDNPMQLASVMTKQYNVDRTNMDQNDIFDPEKELLKNIHTQNYEFDENGNMTSVYVASNDEQEVNNDQNPENQTPGEEQQASEETEGKDVLKSFLWDEENRLLAVNNNGSVSCYFYDAAGERTVKLTSESEMVHVNGKKVGGNDNICKFTAYVSPYFVVSNGGAYTKHIYAANQRIASKLGNVDGFGADPRRVEMAGGKKISDFQKDKIGARFEELGFTYSAPEKEKVIPDSTVDSEEKESLVFYYHPDHLGSTSYVTDADGNIAQHVEYIPYGEIFVEERNNQFSTNYLFNAKELDNETGLYYYGARYLDPMGAMWLSVDPLFENYPGMSPYNYCKGNPVVLIDPDGLSDQSANLGGPCRRAPNGHNNIFYKAGKTLKNLFGKLHIYRPGYRKFQKIKKEP
ncbi:MAG: type IV secretion protein Rhs, partial [Paludibacteraceae bacterium]|nr:type IV secretion protein Rhs [Paludibacteraceae bacterium]